MRRLMIAGTNSGCGKTSITCALLSAIKLRGINPTSFKCGPDYVDPMFHRSVFGVDAYNLDPFFLGDDGLRYHLKLRAGEMTVIEGAMGFYDGIAATNEASAYTVARETKTPVILVVNTKGAGASLGALIEGFARHREDSGIKGVIFNGASEARYPDLEKIAKEAGVRAYGYMPHNKSWELPSRHLGLLTTDEINGLKEILSEMGRQAEISLDIDGLLEITSSAPDFEAEAPKTTVNADGARLAVAKDEAFCFHYEDNLKLFRELGCEILFFSPIHDKALPDNINGIYLGGGYPELYKDALSQNIPMRDSINSAIKSGMPTIAEGGGFLYLNNTLDGSPMCGVINAEAFATKKLQRFGYITLTASKDNLLCNKGESIRAHEFHYWDSTIPGGDFTAKKAGRDISYNCVHASPTMYAGFPNLYFPANVRFAENFVSKMSVKY